MASCTRDERTHAGTGRLCAAGESRLGVAPDSGGNVGLAEVVGRAEASDPQRAFDGGGAFTETIVREMARKSPRPIIFPLSNPTSNSEAKPRPAALDGGPRAGSDRIAFPVSYGGRSIRIPQCNNVYIFPAIGLAVGPPGPRA